MKVKIRDMLLMITDMILVLLVFNFCYHYTVDYIDGLSGAYTEMLGVMLPVYFTVLFLFGTYRSLWRYAEAKEFLVCSIASFTAGAAFFAISRWSFEDKIPFYFYVLTSAFIS